MKHTVDYFDALFEGDADPWQFKSRWYEARKRALTLACLPRMRYECAYEPGCANGELSAALATRCDSLLITDGSKRAVDLATARLAGVSNVYADHLSRNMIDAYIQVSRSSLSYRKHLPHGATIPNYYPQPKH